MNKDVTELNIAARGRASDTARGPLEGAMPLAFVVIGALTFPVVLIAALAGGLQLLTAALVAMVLSGPAALVVYLALALTSSRSS